MAGTGTAGEEAGSGMGGEGLWTFTDDRGHRSSAPGRPRRVVGYVRAAAALNDWGLPPAGAFGSLHDGAAPDPAKSGTLDWDATAYLGAGTGIDESVLHALGPDLVVSVTYDDASLYAVPAPLAARLTDRYATVALSVGGGRSLPAVLDRFAHLAAALGADPGSPAAARAAAGLAAAEESVRAAALARPGTRVLALSGGDEAQVHLARPAAWPELRRLAELGVRLVDPAPGAGASWATVPWAAAATHEPDIVLYDMRANALPLAAARSLPYWDTLTGSGGADGAVPWNPELPCSPAGAAGLLRNVADALVR